MPQPGWRWTIVVALALVRAGAALADEPRSGAELYRSACAACHGEDGRGASQSLVALDLPLPDFTDCNFATREPDKDWLAVASEGGPARAFDERMPAFEEALTLEQRRRIVAHMRTFCRQDGWPRGELNLPLAMFTEKAFPEDEVVLRVGAALEGEGSASSRLVLEKRLGARTQAEVIVPFSFDDPGGAGWRGGIGDVALGVKRVLFASLGSRTIFSATGEILLPTGDSGRGFGAGTPVFEPFLALGQGLGALGFVQLQVGAELPFDTDRAAREGFARAAFGRSFTQGRWGRVWTPMVEVLAASELDTIDPAFDVVPQVQVTLNTRQNVMANVALRVPVDQPDAATALYVYLLWDFFDGGLFEGW